MFYYYFFTKSYGYMNNDISLRIEILAAVIIKTLVIWHVTLCSLIRESYSVLEVLDYYSG
jgi:hypothetical protein